MSKQECEICGEHAAIHEIRPAEYTYKGQSFTIEQPAIWCNVCGEAVISGEDNMGTAVDMQTEKAKIDGILPPLSIKQVREDLGLTQKEAGNIFGGGVNAFSRYERGINPPSQALSLLLLSLESDQKSLKKLLKKRADLTRDTKSANEFMNSVQTNHG
jgi:HTH-type transcriptional regulator/antitoxin MqsA